MNMQPQIDKEIQRILAVGPPAGVNTNNSHYLDWVTGLAESNVNNRVQGVLSGANPYKYPRKYRDGAGRMRDEGIEGMRIRTRMEEAFDEGRAQQAQAKPYLDEDVLGAVLAELDPMETHLSYQEEAAKIITRFGLDGGEIPTAENVVRALRELNTYVQTELIPSVRNVVGGQPLLDAGWDLVDKSHKALKGVSDG